MSKIRLALVAMFLAAFAISGVSVANEPAAAPAAAKVKCKVGDKVEEVATEKDCADKKGTVEKEEHK